MRTFPLWLTVSLLVVVGLQLPSQIQAASYSLESVPVYQLGIQNDPDPDVFSFPADFFLTTSVEEMNAALGHGWENRGIVCYVSPVKIPGTTPLWRLHHSVASDHLCTTSWDERQRAIGMGFRYEGVVGYVFARDATVSGMAPLYRFYAGGNHTHHVYSLDPAAGGGSYEGIECLVWSTKTQIASMTVTAPKPGEELKGASEYDICWNSSRPGGYVSLNYSTDSGTSWMPIECGLVNKSFATWRVPNIETQHARVQIVWTDELFGATNVLAIAESPLDFKIARVPLNIPRGRMLKTTAQLPKPTAMTAKVVSASGIKLSWKAVTGDVRGYIVERRSGDGQFLQVANVKAPGLTFTDNDLSPGTRYLYRVTAYGQGINSGHSTEVSASTAFSLKRASGKSKVLAAPRSIIDDN